MKLNHWKIRTDFTGVVRSTFVDLNRILLEPTHGMMKNNLLIGGSYSTFPSMSFILEFASSVYSADHPRTTSAGHYKNFF